MGVDWMRSRRRVACVVLPDLSSPSMTMNAPRVVGGDITDGQASLNAFGDHETLLNLTSP